MAKNIQQANTFSNQAKSELKASQELNDQGLIWRKLSNGTGSWRYDFRVNGKRYKGSIGKEQHGITLSAARKKLAEEKARATLETPSLSKQKNSPAYRQFEEVAEDYLKWSKINLNGYRQLESKLNSHLLPAFSELTLSDITIANVEQLKSSLLNQGYNPSTIKKVISLLSSIFNHAKKYDPNIVNPTIGLSKIKYIPKQMTTLSECKVEYLIESSSDETKLTTIIGLAAYAGLRASEILGLEWKNIDLIKNEIRVCQRVVEGEFKEITKSGKVRIIPISGKLLTILKKHKLATENYSFVIFNKNGDHYHHIQKLFGQIKINATANFEGGIHILRHTFATIAIKKGVDLPTVQLWMGHSDIKTTMKYIHINSEHSSEQMKLLG